MLILFHYINLIFLFFFLFTFTNIVNAERTLSVSGEARNVSKHPYSSSLEDNTSKKEINTSHNSISGEDDPIIAAIDSLMFLKIFENSGFKSDIDSVYKININTSNIPRFADLVYECRLSELNTKTPIELDYNEIVQKYIDVYTITRRDQLSRMLGLAQLYYPIFENELDRHNLPLELKHLAVVESALNPLAVSSSGATGLWQFLYHAGGMFDLKVDSYIDERRDPYKSTKAACEYLEYLYRIFNDWQLALAAYNGGPGIVRNAIIRSGGKTDFWEIRPYLPLQTQNYVPAFIAVNYAMNFAAEHNIFPTMPEIFFYETDTVHIIKPVYFSRITEILNIPIKTIEFLNPAYKSKYIPCNGSPVTLVLPVNKITDFIKHENEIFCFEPSKDNYLTILNKTGSTENKIKITYIVRKGESLHEIAIKYKCTVGDIKSWNNMQDEYIFMGKKLDIWSFSNLIEEIKQEERISLEEKAEGKYIYYTVQKGDNWWRIANKFNCEDINEILLLNNLTQESILLPGTKLKIYSHE